MLRKIVGKKVRHRRVKTIGGWTPYYVKRTVEVFLECRHAVEVEFGRRPKGLRMRCVECREAAEDSSS